MTMTMMMMATMATSNDTHDNCYDHVQLWDLSGYSGRIAAL